MKENANIMEKTEKLQISKQLPRGRGKCHVAFTFQGDFWVFNFNPGKHIHITCRTDLKPRPPDLNTAALATRPKLFPNNKLWMYDTWCNSISPLVAKAPYLDTSFGPNQGRIRNCRCTRRIQECWCNYDHIRRYSKRTRHRLKVNTFCVNSCVN